VLHAEPRAAAKLAAFTHDRAPWIVAVNMVSEGVDIPRLRVGVYATAAKTPLVFRQIVGRFVRTLPGRPPEPSWLYIPADPVLRTHAAGVEHELDPVVLRRRGAGEEGAESEAELDRPGAREGEAGALDFEPLLADVAPQMTLFGPAPAAAPASYPPAPAPVPAPDPDPGRPVPAFERRNRLRNERHRLVSEVARRDGSSHREVNAWVNRSLGVGSVEKATVEQLERSIELLVRRLSPRR
jgi:hypothetical protein